MKKYNSVYLGRNYTRGISIWEVFREGEPYPERTLLKAISIYISTFNRTRCYNTDE